MSRAARLSTLARVLRAEGPRATLARALDRLADWNRHERVMEVHPRGWPAPETTSGVLNVLPTPPALSLGGVQVQLLKRLEVEARWRPVQLLFRRRDAWRVEMRWPGIRLAVPLAGDLSAVLREALRLTGSASLHVENAAGLPLPELAELAASLPLILSLHDFAPFCPRPMLIEQPAGRFCGASSDRERCGRCLASDGSGARATIEALRHDGARLLRAARALVFPSEFLRARLVALIDGLGDVPQAVIAPSSGAARPARGVTRAGPPHAALVGAVRADKGADVFAGVVSALRGGPWRFSAYGGGDAATLLRLRAAGVQVRGYYRAGTLGARLRADGVTVALLLSLGPESYGLTLDECAAAGIPAIVFDVGAPAERVRAWQAGRVVPLQAGCEGVCAALRDGDFCPVTPPALPTPESAAEAHRALYARLGLL